MMRCRQLGGVVVAVATAAGCCVLHARRLEAHLYTRGEVRVGVASAESYWHDSDDGVLTDAGLIVRPLLSGGNGMMDWQLEADLTTVAGDTRERLSGLGLIPPPGAGPADRDLFDLAHAFSEGNRHRTALRVDRLSARFSPDWGSITVGRHAVTWSGGLIFNSFDLFNPFAPGDVVRDFKTGSDMLHLDVPLRDASFQALAVGRRDPIDGEASLDASSFAGLYQRTLGALVTSAMFAWHYGEPVAGIALDGDAGGAAWHVDATWIQVRPEAGGERRGYFSAVANIQYAWVTGGKNTYGLLEYYFNGLGTADYGTALLDPVRATQFSRGNLFVLGRNHLAASVQVEWHPLLNVFISAITNLGDPSMLLQPRALWDASEHLRVTFGVDLPIGRRGSEYGGYDVAGIAGTTRAPATGYVLATLEF